MKWLPNQEYTAEFKEQAVKHAQAVGIVVAARDLGLVEQTLRNSVKASEAGKLVGAGAKPVTPEQRSWSCPHPPRMPWGCRFVFRRATSARSACARSMS